MSKQSAETNRRNETRNHLRRTVRLYAQWSHDYFHKLHHNSGTATVRHGAFVADKPRTSHETLCMLIGTGLDLNSRKIVARNAAIVRKGRIG